MAAANEIASIPSVKDRNLLKLLPISNGMGLAHAPSMTQPRRLLPGRTYLITRRVIRSHYLLRPDDQTNNVFIFVMAFLAEKYGIIIHATTVMSTHHHTVLTDPNRNLPKFLEQLHRLTALAMKIYRKWEGPLWDHEPTSVVELRTPQAVVENIAYVMGNPSDAGAVYHAEDWPGIVTKLSDLGKGRFKAELPDVYFDKDNEQWPKEVTLKLEMPAGLEEHFDDPIEAINQEYKRIQKEARRRMKDEGRSFMGVDKSLKVSPYKRSKSWEQLRSLNPTFAVGRGQPEAKKQAMLVLYKFRKAYRKALDQWKEGVRDVLFPLGTWWMKVFHKALVSDTA